MNNKNQGYTILSILLVIVTVIVVISIWSLSGQSNTSKYSTSSPDIQASTIINDGAILKLAVDDLIITKNANIRDIIYAPDTEGTYEYPNIIDPKTGIPQPNVNPNSLRSGYGQLEGYWVFNPYYFRGNGIGTTAGYDAAMTLIGIKDSVCQRINYNLYGSTTIPTFNYTPQAYEYNKEGPTSVGGINFTTTAAVKGWMRGCVKTNASPDYNMYFNIVAVE